VFTTDWSFLDGMTALLNKKHALARFDAALAEGRAGGEAFAVMMIDIDRLKRFCDQRTHASGDKAIRAVANVLADLWTERVLPCRFGGEEFAVALRGYQPPEARAFAEQVRAAVAAKSFPDFQTSEPVGVTVSIGVAGAVANETLTQLLHRADEALGAAKNAGRNRVVWGGSGL
jgi:diguanylate cyclase (GGDEF)-like protein